MMMRRLPLPSRKWTVPLHNSHSRKLIPSIMSYSSSTPLFKRKVAICVGYIGTNFRGLQQPRTRNCDDGVVKHQTPEMLPTIELELEKALHKAGCITSMNLGDLDRLGWSRMGRTDKGVHAAFNVVAGNLVVDNVENSNSKNEKLRAASLSKRLDEIRLSLNESLPPQIRCWGLAKVPGGFRAQQACDWREYEYVLPSSLIHGEFNTSTTSPTASDSPISGESQSMDTLGEKKRKEEYLFRATLGLFEGTNSFHNFTKSSALKDNLKGKVKTNKIQRNDEEKGTSENSANTGLETTAITAVNEGLPKKDVNEFNENELLDIIFNRTHRDVATNRTLPPKSQQYDSGVMGANEMFDVEDVDDDEEVDDEEQDDDDDDDDVQLDQKLSDKDHNDSLRLRMSKLRETSRTITECRVVDKIVLHGGMCAASCFVFFHRF
jgi:tRNA pseudouridine(38-40) synthase